MRLGKDGTKQRRGLESLGCLDIVYRCSVAKVGLIVNRSFAVLLYATGLAQMMVKCDRNPRKLRVKRLQTTSAGCSADRPPCPFWKRWGRRNISFIRPPSPMRL